MINDYFVLRSPLLAFHKLIGLNARLKEKLDDKNILKETFSDPQFLEALYLASPALYYQCLKWTNDQLTVEKDIKKLTNTLYKYYVRMTSRSVPFGTFAGFSDGTICGRSELISSAYNVEKKHIRFDMDFLLKFSDLLLDMPDVKSHVRFFPNNSIYLIGDQIRLTEYIKLSNTRQYKLSQIDESYYLDILISRAKNGLTIGHLVDILVSDGVDQDDAENYLSQLIENQILVSDLEPNVTGEDYFSNILNILSQVDSLKNLYQDLQNLQNRLSSSDTIHNYQEIYNDLKKYFPDLEEGNLLQVDTEIKMKTAELSTDIVSEIQQQMEELYLLNTVGKNPDLENFKTRFLTRYESQSIPLVQALDPDVGIGYGEQTVINHEDTSFTDDLFIKSMNPSPMHSWDKLKALQFTKYIEAIKEGSSRIELKTREIEDIIAKQEDLKLRMPGSYFIHGSLIGSNFDLTNREYNFLLLNCGGPSAANIMARLCYGEKLKSKIINSLKFDEIVDENAIYAEIVHLPEGKTGNILCRPALREFEVPYLAKSGVSLEKQISIDDLWITVKNDEIFMFSKKHKKRVIPRLSSAHNFANSKLNIYKFLCGLQSQGIKAGFVWNWGILSNQPFLPRVSYKNIVVERASWSISKDELQNYRSESGISSERLSEFLKKRELPAIVVLADGDNELILDLKTEMSVNILLDALDKSKSIRIRENLFTEQNLFMKNELGEKFMHELVIPLNKTSENDVEYSFELAKQTNTKEVKRVYLVGSEWLYLKIYCGEKTADGLLANEIEQITKQLLENDVIEKWFFIRYNDPENHLRIRFKGKADGQFFTKVLAAFNERLHSLVETGIISNIQIDTYKREIERYGGNNIDFSELLFYYDSLAITQFLANHNYSNILKIQFALYGIDQYFETFDISEQEKLLITEQLHESFFTEFGHDKILKIQLDGKFRSMKDDVLGPLTREADDTNPIPAHLLPLNDRTRSLKAFLDINGTTTTDIYRVLPSYLHMFINRLFSGQQRKQELLIYSLLLRHYKAVHAKKKYFSKVVVQE